MSSAWSWYLIIGTVVTLVACFWVVAYANKQRVSEEDIAESESHVWDEDVRELNNPLPMWWFWLGLTSLGATRSFINGLPRQRLSAGSKLSWSIHGAPRPAILRICI